MEITIYTSPTCGQCTHMRTLLNRANLEWTELVIGDSISIDEFRSLYPKANKTPFVVIDDGEVKRNYDSIVEVAKLLLKKGLVELPAPKEPTE